ncbi:hypothetical protein Tco_0236636 [Tanacetum coccineum]
MSDDRYILYDHVMHPLAHHYERKTRADHGTKRCRHSTSSSTSALVNPSSSHPIDDENIENNDGISRASSCSPTRFVNSLSNNIPQVFSNAPITSVVMVSGYMPSLFYLNDDKGKGKAIMKDKKQKLTGIKEVDELEKRIKNVEAIFSS